LPYVYEAEKPWIFTDLGQRDLLRVLDKARYLLDIAGACMSSKIEAAATDATGWQRIALTDRLVELGELREIHIPDVAGQDRVFVKGRKYA
jgi:hypothetical protein